MMAIFGIDVNDVKHFKSQRKAATLSFPGSSIFSKEFCEQQPDV